MLLINHKLSFRVDPPASDHHVVKQDRHNVDQAHRKVRERVEHLADDVATRPEGTHCQEEIGQDDSAREKLLRYVLPNMWQPKRAAK